jgi:hypothetical protein
MNLTAKTPGAQRGNAVESKALADFQSQKTQNWRLQLCCSLIAASLQLGCRAPAVSIRG